MPILGNVGGVAPIHGKQMLIASMAVTLFKGNTVCWFDNMIEVLLTNTLKLKGTSFQRKFSNDDICLLIIVSAFGGLTHTPKTHSCL